VVEKAVLQGDILVGFMNVFVA